MGTLYSGNDTFYSLEGTLCSSRKGTFCSGKSSVETLVCRVVGTIRHMYDFLVPLTPSHAPTRYYEGDKQEYHQQFGLNIEESIIKKLVVPYLRKVSHILNNPSRSFMKNPLDLTNFINDKGQVYFLKIMLHHSRTVKNILALTEHTADPAAPSTNLLIIDYVTHVLKVCLPNYANNMECPHFLAFKLLCESRDC